MGRAPLLIMRFFIFVCIFLRFLWDIQLFVTFNTNSIGPWPVGLNVQAASELALLIMYDVS